MSLVPVLGPGRNVCLNLEATALAEEPEFQVLASNMGVWVRFSGLQFQGFRLGAWTLPRSHGSAEAFTKDLV